MIATNYSYGIERDEGVLKRNDLTTPNGQIL